MAIFASLLFIPNLAKELGAGDSEIGIIGATYGLAVFASSYVFGRAADVHNRKSIIRLGLFLSVFATLLQALTDPYFFAPLLSSPLLLAVVRCFVGFSFGMFPPAIIAYVFESKGSLGRLTGFGALGWSVGTLVAGFVTLYWGVFVFSSACMLLAFLLAVTLPDVGKTNLKIPFFPKDLLRKNWSVYLPFFLRHWGASCIWIIYPLYILDVGGDRFWVGVLYTVNTVTQFIVMQFVDRVNGRTLLNAGLILSSLTFFTISFAQSFVHLFPAQILLGSSWSCLYVGSLVLLMKQNPEKSTSGGILGSLISLATVFGSILGGVLSEFFGFKATMYVAIILTVTGFSLFRFSSRKLQK